MAGRKRPINAQDSAELILIEQPRKKLLEQIRMTDNDIAGYLAFKRELQMFGWPNVTFSQNSIESNMYRNRMQWDEHSKQFYFNWLGFNQVQRQRQQLQELIDSECQLDTKCRWIFGDFIPPVGVTLEGIIETRNQSLNEILRKYAGELMHVKSEETQAFKAEFSEAYFTINGCDASKGHRQNRELSIKKIREIINYHGLAFDIHTQEVERKKYILINSK
jgi:hypothetical protein